MIGRRDLVWLVFGIGTALVLLFAACGSSEVVTVDTPTDTVYVQLQTWVGIEFTWADSGPLNNDVQAKRLAGWDCGDSLLDLPYWLPVNAKNTEWILMVAHFYLCTAPDPYAASEPFKLPELKPAASGWAMLTCAVGEP